MNHHWGGDVIGVFADAFPQGSEGVVLARFSFDGNDVVTTGDFAFLNQEINLHPILGNGVVIAEEEEFMTQVSRVGIDRSKG